MRSRFLSRAVTVAAAVARHALMRKRQMPVQPRRILIAHHLRIGDTLMLTPLLAKLRRLYPQAQLVLLTPKALTHLYRYRPYDVDAVPYDPRDVGLLLRLLRGPGYDLAFVPGDNRFVWLARALGARWIVAFAGDRPAYKSWLADRLIPYSNVPTTWGDMVAALIEGPAPRPYRPSDWPQPDCTPFALPPKPYAVLHIGASSTLKLWESHKWQALAQWLHDAGYRVVWSGGPGEEHLVAASDPRGIHLSLAGIDLAQLWRLIADADLLVCPDTGASFIGRLTHTPTVTLYGQGTPVLFGAGDFWRDAPFRAVTVENFPCRDQNSLFKREIAWVKRCVRNPGECAHPACMQALNVTDVIAAIADLKPSTTKQVKP